ncbi:hypothetical protein CAPTEDRAFT_217458 [Capitella teleta]|uniref:SUEL-type lectin domain-containing protein n=1 Tax=Capitella teleta TaxID=283909 RepID=R7UGG3_CAPTE|nr:hypothetical protein CAPTEDRAFT_217458 [Capitella teleta]|eukprot:ELU05614.1 hypothetical protein CAPTEDRAFT_217458 [Capitella teleta]
MAGAQVSLAPYILFVNVSKFISVSFSEYCDYEMFQGQCGSHELMQVIYSEYGHMDIGKCVKVDIGYFGCKADVTGILGARCNMHHKCEMDTRDKQLRQTNPCSSGVVVYLEVTFACVKVVKFPNTKK